MIVSNLALFWLSPFLNGNSLKTWKSFALKIFWYLPIVLLDTDFSLILLIKGGTLSGTDTYQSLVNKTFGLPGYLLLSILQFLYPFIGKMMKIHTATIFLNLGISEWNRSFYCFFFFWYNLVSGGFNSHQLWKDISTETFSKLHFCFFKHFHPPFLLL